MKINYSLKQIIIYLVIILPLFSFSQNYIWAKAIGGTLNDEGYSTVTDASGNVYTTGSFNGTSDFDPGAGVFNLSSSGGSDIFISKLDLNGNFIWARAMGGSITDIAYSISLDASGNVYTTGVFAGTADFNPGIGVFNLTSMGGFDVFVSKLDAAGNFVWAKAIGGAGNDYGQSITLDVLGNVLTTGYFNGTADFDPSAGVFNLSSAGSSDIFISKLDGTGNFVWAKAMGGTVNDVGYSIDTDASGNVYTTGFFNGTSDFDPSITIFNITSLGAEDIFISKLDASGNFVWAKSMGGTSFDKGYSICLDASGNIFTTGDYRTTVDFDPNVGVFNLTSAGSADIFISKLDASGNFIWAKSMGGASSESGYSIALDASGNVFSTGYFNGTADFDPGVGIFNLAPSAGSDIFISKLDPSGNFVWAKKLDGAGGSEFGQSITIDPWGSILTTGYFAATVDFDPNIGVFNITSAGNNDAFVHKMCQASPSMPIAIIGTATVCTAVANLYSVSPVSIATSYNWILPSGWSGSSTTNTISATAGTSGVFTITANNACGVSTMQTLSVTAFQSPTISVNSGSICSGSSFTIVPNGANSYTFSNGPVVSPTTTSSYSITGTGSNGCISTFPAISNVTVYSLPLISVNNGVICAGKTFTMFPTGASSYTYQGGSAVVSPTASTSYTVSGTSAQGCISASSATSIVTVNANPTVSATSSNTLICIGQSATLTASGANTYTWNYALTNPSIVGSPTVTVNYTLTGAYSNGCTSTIIFTQYVSNCTYIDQGLISKNLINIYPNPFINTLTFISDKTENNIQIFNSLGKLVLSTVIEKGKSELDLHALPSGVYYLKIGTETKKIVKT